MEGYNGYANYETWNVALWIGNDQGSYEYYGELAERIVRRHRDDRNEAVAALADVIKNEHTETVDNLNLQGFASDILTTALGRVDWREVAEGIIDEHWEE